MKTDQNMSERIFNEGILNGRVAFITGGGTGITGGVARALAEAGAAVSLVSRKLDHLEPAAQTINENGGKAIAVASDVRQPEEVEKAVAQTVEQLGKIAVEHFGEPVGRDVDALVGDPVLWKVIRANLFRSFAGADLTAAILRRSRPIAPEHPCPRSSRPSRSPHLTCESGDSPCPRRVASARRGRAYPAGRRR